MLLLNRKEKILTTLKQRFGNKRECKKNNIQLKYLTNQYTAAPGAAKKHKNINQNCIMIKHYFVKLHKIEVVL
jgi:hypothetical protein